MVNTLIVIALSLSLAGMLVFAIAFQTRANWKASAVGRHMVYFAYSFSLALSTNLLRVAVQGLIIDTIRVASLFLLAAVVWQRSFLLFRSLRRDNADS